MRFPFPLIFALFMAAVLGVLVTAAELAHNMSEAAPVHVRAAATYTGPTARLVRPDDSVHVGHPSDLEGFTMYGRRMRQSFDRAWMARYGHESLAFDPVNGVVYNSGRDAAIVLYWKDR